jgi:hypothetical protein
MLVRPAALRFYSQRRLADPWKAKLAIVVPRSSVGTPEIFPGRVMFSGGARITIQKLGESSECKQRTQNDGLTSR